MTNYDTTIRQLNTIRANLQSKLSEIKNAAEISYGSWDSDARNAYNSVITNIERELNSIINEINTLKMYLISFQMPGGGVPND